MPFVIYADFEAITETISGCQQNNNESYTEEYQNSDIQTVDTVIRLSVAMMMNTVNPLKYTEVKKLCISSWKPC